MTFYKLFVFATLIESIVSLFTDIFENKKVSFKKIGTVIVGVVTAVYYKIDFIILIKATDTSNVVNFILTGFILSRGSNYLFDLIKMILNISNELKATFESRNVAGMDLGIPFEELQPVGLTVKDTLDPVINISEGKYLNNEGEIIDETAD